jgi:hypothetical protein
MPMSTALCREIVPQRAVDRPALEIAVNVDRFGAAL